MTARADMLRSFFECHDGLCAQVTVVADVPIDLLTFTQIVNNFARLKSIPHRTKCKTF